jgi:hypothetical protein
MAEYLLMAEHPGTDGTHHMSSIRIFSDDEMTKYQAACILLIDFHAGFALFDICKRNYADLENTITDIRATDKINRQTAYEHSVEANRKSLTTWPAFELLLTTKKLC